jgi:hypothetical protein
MRHKHILTALFGIGAAALFASTSVAGEWGSGCGCYHHHSYAPPTVYYAQPTYSYAQPTITVYPHYVMQPNYIVQRTYVVPQTYYLRESNSYLFGGDRGYVVNQGQYNVESPIVAPQEYQEEYSPEVYPRNYRTEYQRPRHHLHYKRTAYRRHVETRASHWR